VQARRAAEAPRPGRDGCPAAHDAAQAAPADAARAAPNATVNTGDDVEDTSWVQLCRP
jgi:hypothetical protein